MSNKILPYLIAASAISVSASAAFYSVSGLSKLFAGAAFAVIIMAASLEVAKLVIASLLYQYRNTLPKLLKYYLSIACLVLILITSMGIYGFLSAAYQETAAKSGNVDALIELIETKRNNIQQQLDGYNEEKTSLDASIKDLRSGLSNNVIQYKDRETGEIITTTSSSTRKALERQLDQSIERQTAINTKIDTLNEKLFEYETEIVEASNSASLAGELGPLKYLSNLTGKSMDTIINWLLLVIIFVFDPLAISLVVAANFAFDQVKKKKMIDQQKNNDKEMDHLADNHLVGGMTAPKENGFADFIKKQESREEQPNQELKQAFERHKEEVEEWDEMHAHDMALNDAIDKLDPEDLEWLEEQVKKEKEREDIYRDRRNERNSYWT